MKLLVKGMSGRENKKVFLHRCVETKILLLLFLMIGVSTGAAQSQEQHNIDGSWSATFTDAKSNNSICADALRLVEGTNEMIFVETAGNKVVFRSESPDNPFVIEAVRVGSNTYRITETETVPIQQPSPFDSGSARVELTLTFTSDDRATGTLAVEFQFLGRSTFRCSGSLSVVAQRPLMKPPVVNLSARQRQVVVSWDRVATGAVFYRYELYTATASLISRGSVDPLLNTQFTLRDLNPGSAYYLHVSSAINSGIVASGAAKRSFITMPFIDDEVGVGFRVATLTWPVMDGMAMTYRFSWVGSAGEQSTQEVLAQNGSYTLTGLQPNTEYSVRVVAQQEAYPDSEPLLKQFTTLKLQLPAPTRFTVAVDVATAVVSWEVDDAGEAATYFISYTPGGEEGVGTTVLRKSFRLTGLSPDTQYTLNIVAQADGFRDSASFTTTFRTLEEQLSTPTGFAIVADVTTATVSWEVDDANEATTYFISYTPGGEEGVGTAVLKKRFELSGLSPDTQYTLSVVAQADGFRDSTSFITTFRTLKEQLLTPIGFTVAVDATTATVSWDADTAGKAMKYLISYEPGNAAEVMGLETDVTRESSTLDGLLPDTDYTLNIIALADGFRDSAPFTTIFRTLEPRLSKVFFVQVAGETTLSVVWNDVAGDATTYVLTLSTTTETGMREEEVMALAGSYEFRGLTANREYTIALTALAEGFRDSAPSERTEKTLQESEELRLPAQPTSIRVTLGRPGDRNVDVRWNTVADITDAPVTGYQVLWKKVGSEEEDSTLLEQGMVTYRITGLTMDTSYEVTVLSYNRYGASGETAARREIRTLRAQLMRPAIMVAEKTTESVILQWTVAPNQPDMIVYAYVLHGAETNRSSIVAARDEQLVLENLEEDTVYMLMATARLAGHADSSLFTTRFRTKPRALRLRLRVFLEGPMQ